jgi:hypothetical protein
MPIAHPSDVAVEGEPLPDVVRERLRPAIGQSIGDLRVHQDAAADAWARAHRADAVTVNSDVFFRTGRYRPHTPDGLALVAHEALHVAEGARATSTWRRSTAVGRADEERDALRVERAVLPATSRRARRSTPVIGVLPPPPVVTSVVPAATPMAVPRAPIAAPTAPAAPRAVMAAATDRSLDDGGGTNGAGADYGEMRRALYQGLLGEMRTDFERGA